MANQRIANGRVNEWANQRRLEDDDADGLRPLVHLDGGQGLTDLVEEAVEVDGSGTPPFPPLRLQGEAMTIRGLVGIPGKGVAHLCEG